MRAINQTVGPFGRDLCTAIRSAAAARGLHIYEVAAAADVSDDYLYRRLQGHKTLTVSDVERISAALGMDVYDLLALAAQVRHPNSMPFVGRERVKTADELRALADRIDPPADNNDLSDEERKQIMLTALQDSTGLAANHDEHRDSEIQHGSERY